MSENERIEPEEQGEVEKRDPFSQADAIASGEAKEIHPVVFFNKDFTPFGSPTEADIETGIYDFRPKNEEQVAVLADLEDEAPKDSSAPASVGSSELTIQEETGSTASLEPIAPVEKVSGPPKESASGTQTSSDPATPGKNEPPAAT